METPAIHREHVLRPPVIPETEDSTKEYVSFLLYIHNYDKV
jgi:hypothetical protein